MSYHAGSIVTAVNIAYHMGGEDPRLLGIAAEQGQVLLDDAGFAVAAAVRDGKAMPYEKKSVNLSDGPDGKQGGVAVLRHGDTDLELVFKYSSQGLSHGHYDKLSFSLFENGDEILQEREHHLGQADRCTQYARAERNVALRGQVRDRQSAPLGSPFL
jgi:hypothetical protein